MEVNKSNGLFGTLISAYFSKYAQRYLVIFIFTEKIVISHSYVSHLGQRTLVGLAIFPQ